MVRIIFLSVLVLGLFLGWSNLSHAQNPFIQQFQNVLGQQPASANNLLDIMRSVAGFLVVSGGILAGIAIIASGVMYMAAGSNQTRVVSAKAIFKNGVIGALILFASGLIINTIILFAVDWSTFFS